MEDRADVLVGNEEDLQWGLGIPGPEAAAQSKLDPSAFVRMIDRVLERFLRIKVTATTLRDVHSANRHVWAAVAWIDGRTHVSKSCDLDIHDRIGGSDGFVAVFFYGRLNGESAEEALKLGWAHGRPADYLPGRYHHGHIGTGAGFTGITNMSLDSWYGRAGNRIEIHRPYGSGYGASVQGNSGEVPAYVALWNRF